MKKVNIKYILLAVVLSGMAIACTKVEPLEMVVETHTPDHTTAKSYKEVSHPRSLVWVNNWQPNGTLSGYLSSLPDSLDMALLPIERLEGNLSVIEEKDLQEAREVLGIKLGLRLDLSAPVLRYREQMDGLFDEVLLDHPELDEGNPEDLNEINRLVAAGEERLKEELTAGLKAKIDHARELIKKYQLKVFSLVVESLDEVTSREVFRHQIEALRTEGVASELLIFEGDGRYLTNLAAAFDYLIPTPGAGEDLETVAGLEAFVASYQKLEGFSVEKLLLPLLLEAKPWERMMTDALSTRPCSVLEGIASYQKLGLTGIALKPIQDEESQGYPHLRRAIQILSDKQKN